MGVTIRLDKMLCHMGYGTRSEIRRFVREGVVVVNGCGVKDSGKPVDPDRDRVWFKGEEVKYRKFVYLMMNKPAGVVSATEDVRDRTVIDLLERPYAGFGLFPVGRLDKDTEGLLLLTNDGQLAHRLLSPRKQVPKTYFAQVEGVVTLRDRDVFARGVTLDDGYETLPASLRILESAEAGPSVCTNVELTIVEGKFHQIKRMFLAVGKRVVYLKRLSMGTLTLDGNLASGHARELSAAELDGLLRMTQPHSGNANGG